MHIEREMEVLGVSFDSKLTRMLEEVLMLLWCCLLVRKALGGAEIDRAERKGVGERESCGRVREERDRKTPKKIK